MFLKVDGKLYKSIISFGMNNATVKLYAKNRKAQKVELINKSPYIISEHINDYIITFTIDTKPFRKIGELTKHIEDNISLMYSINFEEEDKYVSKEIYIILG